MDTKTDYYRVLHVQRDAPVEIIKASYRTLMQKLRMHPDLGGDRHRAALLNEAYAILTDTRQRAIYDAMVASRMAGDEVVRRPTAQPRGPQERRSAPTPETRSCPFCRLESYASEPEMDDVCARCESPLFPAERLRLEGLDRRAVERLTRQHPALLYTHWRQCGAYDAIATDVSLQGVQILSPRSIGNDQTVKIDSELCSAVGTVVRCRRSRAAARAVWSLGVAFITVRFARLRGGFVCATV